MKREGARPARSGERIAEDGGPRRRAAGWVREAFSAFLAVPIVVAAGFLVLAAGLYFVDQAFWSSGGQPPDRLRWLGKVFGDKGALSSLLDTIATSLITVTSITFSLLLVAVQQGASSYTNQVFDQFLRRRGNQFYFGFFVGLSVFALVNLVTANAEHRPIFGALAATLLTAVALCLIVVLIYTTIDQSRPNTITAAIHDHVLKARKAQHPLLKATRRPAGSPALPLARRVVSEHLGFVTAIAVDQIIRAVASCSPVEVELRVVVGSFVAYHDPLAELRCDGGMTSAQADAMAKAITAAITLEEQRDLDQDPALGIQQLATIGWTSVSTAHSNPQPGILVCQALRDIIARWSEPGESSEDRSSPVIYDDRVPGAAIATLESLTVVSSESMQHQTLAEIMRTFALLLPELSPDRADQVAGIVLRSLSSLGEHVLTRELEDALDVLSQALAATGHDAAAEAVTRATGTLRRSIGVLRSRSTRVPTGGGG